MVIENRTRQECAPFANYEPTGSLLSVLQRAVSCLQETQPGEERKLLVLVFAQGWGRNPNEQLMLLTITDLQVLVSHTMMGLLAMAIMMVHRKELL